jgi:hypothetical protein
MYKSVLGKINKLQKKITIGAIVFNSLITIGVIVLVSLIGDKNDYTYCN